MGKEDQLLTDVTTVIDEIYEAAVVPETWTRVLDRLAEISGAQGTFMFASDAERTQWLCSPAIRPDVDKWFDGTWTERNARRQRLIPMREPRFLTDLDAFTMEEIEKEPYYQQFLRPLGYGWCAGTTIRTPAGDTLVFTSERLYAKGPVERSAVQILDGLRPHLARAAVLSARVGLERARATVDALQTIGLAAAVLSPTGRVIAANRDFSGASVSIGAQDRVVFTNSATHDLFREALAAVEFHGAPAGRSIPVPGADGTPPLVAHLLPLRGQGRDVFSGAASLLYLMPVLTSQAPAVGLLEVLFDLTPAEARVATFLVEGKAVDEIARALGVTDNTVRMHLKSIFAKTGVGRQAELVSLLAMPRLGGAVA